MARLFYSYKDGELYVLHQHCSLATLMDEQSAFDGLLIHARKGMFEMVEYINGKEHKFKTKMTIEYDENALVREIQID